MGVGVLGAGLTYADSSDLTAADVGREVVREFQSAPGLWADVEAVAWWADWKQSSLAANRFGTNAIKVDYAIADAPAYEGRAKFGWKWLRTGIDYVQQAQGGSDGAKAVTYLKMAIDVVDLLPNLEFQYRRTQGSFSGVIIGANNAGLTGTGTFESIYNDQEANLIYAGRWGLGYRYVGYAIPQDLYVVNTASPNTAVIAGFQEMAYRGHFIQALFQSEPPPIRDTEGVHLSYRVKAGYGLVQPTGAFLDQTTATLRTGGFIGAGESLMDRGTAWHLEAEFGADETWRFGGRNILKLGWGYRYQRFEATFGASGTYAMLGDFRTEFRGPYGYVRWGF